MFEGNRVKEDTRPEFAEDTMMPRERLADSTADWEADQAYLQLFVCNPQPMWVYDPETLRFLAVNKSMVNEYG